MLLSVVVLLVVVAAMVGAAYLYGRRRARQDRVGPFRLSPLTLPTNKQHFKDTNADVMELGVDRVATASNG